MSKYYKSDESERLVQERYRKFLQYWPVPNQQLRVPTREGETFVIASGDPAAPALLLFHGGLTNSVIWMGDVVAWSKHFRVYAVDMIGEPGLSAPSRPSLRSEAYALWLADVLKGLSVSRASMVGASLGGWLALDYATRRPEVVEKIAVLCPGGVGRQKVAVLFKLLFLQMLGKSGKRRAAELVLGRPPANPSPAIKAFGDFLTLIAQTFGREGSDCLSSKIRHCVA
jgi:pimeloyl-ACP methyl ester carboxylesterase